MITVGGGAAGCMAAVAAAETGAHVLLLERNEKIGRKLSITGKGRCNVTNACDLPVFFSQVISNPKFLQSALSRFTPEDTCLFFEQAGVPLKKERGNRIFPVSDCAYDVVDALFRKLHQFGVSVTSARAVQLRTDDKSSLTVRDEKGREYAGRSMIIACGGVTYPATGSTGDGYTLAKSVGHTVTKTRGSLCALIAPGFDDLEGLSLRNVELSVKTKSGKCVFRERGEMIFTSHGISGPLVLRASAFINTEAEEYTAFLNFKPALSAEKLDERILREISEHPGKTLCGMMETLEPKALIPHVLSAASLEKEQRVSSLTGKERKRLGEVLQSFPIPILAAAPIQEAIVTSGGVNVREVNPKNMESKLMPGLFFAGEVLDVDAMTGGFNLQIAWSTGRAAGIGAAEYVRSIIEQRG